MQTKIALTAALVLACALTAPAALGASAAISWQMPTQNVDNSAIPATGTGSIASTRVEWGSCNGTAFGTKAGETVIAAPAATATIPNLAAGSTVCFRADVKNTFGDVSALSNIVARIMPTPVPRPPVLSATINVAFVALPNGKLQLAGTIPLGAPCGDASRVFEGVRYNTVAGVYVSRYNNRPADTFFTICEA